MPFSFRLVQPCSLALLLVSVTLAQTVSSAQVPTPGNDGVYEVAASDLKRLDSSPEVEFPRELSAYDAADTVVLAVTVSPDGRVKKAKVLSGKIDALKDAAEKTVKKWTFQPYLVNGAPVQARTEITINFDNTFNRYRDPNGDVPVHLDEKASHALVVKSVPPNYPPDARTGRIQGAVELRAIAGRTAASTPCTSSEDILCWPQPPTMQCATGNSNRTSRMAKLFQWTQR
jgi:TonB family protein